VGQNAISHTNPSLSLSSSSSSSPKAHLATMAVVYSFLIHNLQALEPNLLSLLKAHNQHAWIDSNLCTLVVEAVAAASSAPTNKPKLSKPPNYKERNMDDKDNHKNVNNDDNNNDDTHKDHHNGHAAVDINDREIAKKAMVHKCHDDDNKKSKRKWKKQPRHE